MTTREQAAREYAKDDNGKAGCFCRHCMQREGDPYAHFLAGCEHEAKVISERLEKWAKDHWIPSPTANDSFWQNDLIRSLLALINPPKEESE